MFLLLLMLSGRLQTLVIACPLPNHELHEQCMSFIWWIYKVINIIFLIILVYHTPCFSILVKAAEATAEIAELVMLVMDVVADFFFCLTHDSLLILITFFIRFYHSLLSFAFIIRFYLSIFHSLWPFCIIYHSASFYWFWCFRNFINSRLIIAWLILRVLLHQIKKRL